jgi:membrane dipeptidase
MKQRSVLLATLTCAAFAMPPAAHADIAKARELAQDAIIVDTHIDAPTELLEKPWVDLGQSVPGREFDWPGARRGGLDVAFMSIYTSASQDADGSAFEIANRQIDTVEALAQRHPDKFALLRSPREVESKLQGGRVLLPLGMENGAPLGRDLARIEFFFHRGVRYIALAHGANNALADSSYEREARWNGLSPLGKQAVAEMNRLGIMVDVSHLSDAATRQVIELSRVPVVATHSAFRHFTPGFERNIADEEAVALAKRGGVVQVAFGSAFVDPVAAADMQALFTAMGEHDKRMAALKAEGKEVPEVDFFSNWQKEHPRQPTKLDAVLDQIDYGVKLLDGVGGDLPEGLKSVADYPNLIEGLQQRGYKDEDIRKILGGNLLRVWREVEEGAAKPAAGK